MIRKSSLLKGQRRELCRISHADTRMVRGIFVLRWIFIRRNITFTGSAAQTPTFIFFTTPSPQCKQNQTNYPSGDAIWKNPAAGLHRCGVMRRTESQTSCCWVWDSRGGCASELHLHSTKHRSVRQRGVSQSARLQVIGGRFLKSTVMFCCEQHYREESSRRKHVICSSVSKVVNRQLDIRSCFHQSAFDTAPRATKNCIPFDTMRSIRCIAMRQETKQHNFPVSTPV